MVWEVKVGRRDQDGTQGGFSMVELMIAMTCTLIISGAIFQLVGAGQNAFRKEPSMSERQQNIRPPGRRPCSSLFLAPCATEVADELVGLLGMLPMADLTKEVRSGFGVRPG